VLYAGYLYLNSGNGEEESQRIRASIDYEGNFQIVDEIKGRNPLLRSNMHGVFSESHHSITRKFI